MTVSIIILLTISVMVYAIITDHKKAANTPSTKIYEDRKFNKTHNL